MIQGTKYGKKKKKKKNVPMYGIEPMSFGLQVRHLIQWATKPT